jgi:Secretion system C-terminal sorting domain
MKSLITILFLCATLLSAQNNFVKPLGQAGPANEILKIKSAIQDFRGFSKQKPYDYSLEGLNGQLDTLDYRTTGFNTNFGFFGQDVMAQWFEAPADMEIKAVSFTTSDDANSVVSVKIVRMAWDKDQVLETAKIGATWWGYYNAFGQGYNDITPFEDDSDPKGEWVEAGPTAQQNLWGSPFAEDIWSDLGEGAPATAVKDQETWVQMDLLGEEPVLLAGELFAVAVKNEGNTLDAGRTGLRATNTLGVPGFKFYRNGRLQTGEDFGWWTRLYTWDMRVAVNLMGDRAPQIKLIDPGFIPFPGDPPTIFAEISDDNPSGGPAGVSSAQINVLYGNDTTINIIPMELISGDSLSGEWSGKILSSSPGTEVTWFVSAKDVNGNQSETLSSSYSVFKVMGKRLVVYDDDNFGIGTINTFWLAGLPPDSTWDWSVDFWEPDCGPVSLELLENYEQVYHIMGDGPVNELPSLGSIYKDWLDQASESTPRYLFLSGQDYAYNFAWPDTSYQPGSFEYDYLGLLNIAPQDVNYSVNGNDATRPYIIDYVPGDTLTGWMEQLYSDSDSSVLAYNPTGTIGQSNWIDDLVLGDGTAILTDPNNNNVPVAVRHEGPYWKTTFWALDPLGLDMINIADSSSTLWVASVQNPAVPVYSWFGDVTGGVSLIEDELNSVQNFALSQNYPNPFNPSTIINYELRIMNEVKLVVYDVLGRKIKTLVNKTQPAGKYKVTFDASGFASGVYYYKLKAGDKFEQTRKMLLLR